MFLGDMVHTFTTTIRHLYLMPSYAHMLRKNRVLNETTAGLKLLILFERPLLIALITSFD